MVCSSIWAAVRRCCCRPTCSSSNEVLQMQGYRVVADPTWNPTFASAAAARAGLTERLVA
jgi:hypothetical protein